jgi:1-acyl-sn-glycerol-3-phosphate acyltransferase
MVLLRSLFFDVVIYTLMFFMGLLCAPLAIWSAAGAYWSVHTYCGIVRKLLHAICGLRTEVRGVVPTGNVIVCSKHQSFLDIIILCSVLPRAKFIMKKELKWMPVLGLYAMRMGSIPVNRGARAQAMKDMVAHAERSGAVEGQLVIYPQGTRVAPDARLPYKIGAGVLYQRFGLPCTPVATNVGVFWGRNSRYRHPGLGVIEFLEQIPPALPIADFMHRLQDQVEENSDRLMLEVGFDPGPRSPLPKSYPAVRPDPEP